MDVCGGGLRVNRYRPENGFDNPSCYCADLRALIEHVRDRVTGSLLALAKDCHKAVTGEAIIPIMGMPADVEPLH